MKLWLLFCKKKKFWVDLACWNMYCYVFLKLCCALLICTHKYVICWTDTQVYTLAFTGSSSTWNSNYTSKGFSYGRSSKDPTPQATPRTGRSNNTSFNDSSLWWRRVWIKGTQLLPTDLQITVDIVLENGSSSTLYAFDLLMD